MTAPGPAAAGAAARDIALLVNPAAGRGRAARDALLAARVLRGAGHTVRAVTGADAADTLRRARAAVAGDPAALVAVGGDGLVSLALQAVAGTSVPLGIIAAGTGNDFARACGLPRRGPAAAAVAVAAALRTRDLTAVDLGRAGSTWFGGVLAAGFDSRVTERGNRMRWPRGRLRYDAAVLAELAALRPLPFRIRLDGGDWLPVPATLVAVGNGASYGGGMRICAGARADDGLFDVTIVGECGRAELLRFFPRVFRGTHLSHPAVTVHRAAAVTLHAPGVTGYADGERLGPLPLTATCVRGAVRVLGARL